MVTAGRGPPDGEHDRRHRQQGQRRREGTGEHHLRGAEPDPGPRPPGDPGGEAPRVGGGIGVEVAGSVVAGPGERLRRRRRLAVADEVPDPPPGTERGGHAARGEQPEGGSAPIRRPQPGEHVRGHHPGHQRHRERLGEHGQAEHHAHQEVGACRAPTPGHAGQEHGQDAGLEGQQVVVVDRAPDVGELGRPRASTDARMAGRSPAPVRRAAAHASRGRGSTSSTFTSRSRPISRSSGGGRSPGTRARSRRSPAAMSWW